MKETVRAWGYETTAYATDLSIEQVKERIVAEDDGLAPEDVTTGDVVAWLERNCEQESFHFEARDIIEREWTELHDGTGQSDGDPMPRLEP